MLYLIFYHFYMFWFCDVQVCPSLEEDGDYTSNPYKIIMDWENLISTHSIIELEGEEVRDII